MPDFSWRRNDKLHKFYLPLCHLECSGEIPLVSYAHHSHQISPGVEMTNCANFLYHFVISSAAVRSSSQLCPSLKQDFSWRRNDKAYKFYLSPCHLERSGEIPSQLSPSLTPDFSWRRNDKAYKFYLSPCHLECSGEIPGQLSPSLTPDFS